MGRREILPTIWKIRGDLGAWIHPVIPDMDPPKSTGRTRVHPQPILDGIIFPCPRRCENERKRRE